MLKKKVLVVLSTTEKYPNLNRATGIWLGEVVHFVKKIEEAGFEVDYVSPKGGYTPIDPHSLEKAEPLDWEWYHNRDFINRLGKTLTPQEVQANRYIAIYYVGGHGTMWDFPDNTELQSISRQIYEAGGVVSSVCHGAVGLLNITLSNGASLIQGKKITGFSNTEEELVGLNKVVPFLTEEKIKERGAHYSKAPEPWATYAVEDQRVITGQNPASGGAVANLVMPHLKRYLELSQASSASQGRSV